MRSRTCRDRQRALMLCTRASEPLGRVLVRPVLLTVRRPPQGPEISTRDFSLVFTIRWVDSVLLDIDQPAQVCAVPDIQCRFPSCRYDAAVRSRAASNCSYSAWVHLNLWRLPVVAAARTARGAVLSYQ